MNDFASFLVGAIMGGMVVMATVVVIIEGGRK